MLAHNNAEVRMWTAWIFASLTQNNHDIFDKAALSEVLRFLIPLAADEKDTDAHSRQIYALSSLLSSDNLLIKEFLDNAGVQLLVPWMLHHSARTRVSIFSSHI